MTENLDTNETAVVEDATLTEAKRNVKKYAIKAVRNLTIAFAAGYAVATIVGKLTETSTED